MLAKRAIFLWIALTLCLGAVSPVYGDKSYSWIRDDDGVALQDEGRIVWQFRVGPEDSKPAFHPLTLSDGRILTGYRPDDHAWHRANWFSWKFLNGKNFWEENETGRGREGITEVVDWQFRAQEGFSAELDIALRYMTLEGNEALREERKIIISSPLKDDYQITTISRFQAKEDTTIDKWHYGGYALRLSPELSGWKFIDDQGKVWDGRRGTMERKHQQIRLIAPATSWMAYVEQPTESTNGIAILDHPENPRHPAHWLALPHMPYFNPVFMYDQDFILNANEELVLRYRLVVFEDKAAVPFLRKEQSLFATESSFYIKQ